MDFFKDWIAGFLLFQGWIGGWFFKDWMGWFFKDWISRVFQGLNGMVFQDLDNLIFLLFRLFKELLTYISKRKGMFYNRKGASILKKHLIG